jgi:hypothetical protein
MIIPSKRVTEEDVKATEARIKESFAGLKHAVKSLPSEATKPMTDVVKKHPYASVATAAGTGFLAYRILSLLLPRTKVVNSEITAQPELELKEHKKSSRLSKMFSQAVALATPYIASYVQNEAARLLSGPKRSPPAESTGPQDII